MPRDPSQQFLQPATAPTVRGQVLGFAHRWLKRCLRPLYWAYQERLERKLVTDGRVPAHLGLILDGNRRFAKALGLDASTGHSMGADTAYDVLEWCADIGIPRVTLWMFSSDNHGREPHEVEALYRLFAEHAERMAHDPRIVRRRVRIRVIGDLSGFPQHVREALDRLEAATADYDGLQLYLAIGYGGREEIMAAMRKALQAKAAAGMALEQATESLCVADISAHLYAAPCPDPDFIIRTSGEVRLSGFMLWQSVYSEFYFCDVYWPAFRKIDFLRAMRNFQQRQRRFGR
jgi:short-chain Z-isoprenyl diphosphate synthase